MATLVEATCSDCFLSQEVELNPRRSEIRCEYCNHSVPMFERRDMDAIRGARATERRKTYIALAFLGGAAFLFALYVMDASREDKVAIMGADGSVKEEGYLIERDDVSITLRDPETKEERRHLYTKVLAEEITRIREEDPLMSEREAAKRAGEKYVAVVPAEPSAMSTPLVILAALTSLGAIASAAIATQDRLVCEF
jgi:DNA-directed RNA polymerase subunit RPC12/RpoP